MRPSSLGRERAGHVDHVHDLAIGGDQVEVHVAHVRHEGRVVVSRAVGPAAVPHAEDDLGPLLRHPARHVIGHLGGVAGDLVLGREDPGIAHRAAGAVDRRDLGLELVEITIQVSLVGGHEVQLLVLDDLGLGEDARVDLGHLIRPVMAGPEDLELDALGHDALDEHGVHAALGVTELGELLDAIALTLALVTVAHGHDDAVAGLDGLADEEGQEGHVGRGGGVDDRVHRFSWWRVGEERVDSRPLRLNLPCATIIVG